MSSKNKKKKSKPTQKMQDTTVEPAAAVQQAAQKKQDATVEPAAAVQQAAQEKQDATVEQAAADKQAATQDAQPAPEKFRRISVDGTDDRMPHSKPAKKSLHADSNLDMLGMSRKERRAARKDLYQKNTAGMSRKEKASYFFDYYKWKVITPILIIALVSYLSVTIYMNKRPVALGFAILNAQDTAAVDLSFEDDYIDHFDITGSYQFKESVGLDIDYDYYQEHSEYIQTSNSTDYSILSSDCDLGSNDVIISNSTGLRYCASQNIIKPLKGYLSEAVYAALEPYMVSFDDPSGTGRTYAIDISSTQFAQDLNPGYTDVYVAFPGAIDRNYTNSLRFLEYVLGIELTE